MKSGKRLEGGIRFLVGGILLFAGIAKALEIYEFSSIVSILVGSSLAPYGGILAVDLVVLECTLGAALVSGDLSKRIYPIAILLFACFMAALASAFRQGIEECGCFGSILSRGSLASMLLNAACIGLLVIGWRLAHAGPTSRMLHARWVTVAGAVGGFLLTVTVLLASPQDLATLPCDRITDLQNEDPCRGNSLVFFFSTECATCQRSVAGVNKMIQTSDVPTVIGLCFQDRQKREKFMRAYAPEFSIGQIPFDVWLRFVRSPPPIFAIFGHGDLRAIWNRGTMPTVAEIIEEIVSTT